MSKHILIVDDEADIRHLIKGILEDEGYRTSMAADAKRAYAELEKSIPDLVILDIWLQGSDHDGLQILENIKKDNPFLPVIMISGHGTIETAVSSIKLGAYDFVEKPFKTDRLLLMIQRGLESAALKRENAALKRGAEEPNKIVGRSSAMKDILDSLNKVSQTGSRILLTGEAGVGKGFLARYVHAQSGKDPQSFRSISCSSFIKEFLDEMLNEGGTLYLDEIADLTSEAQGRLIQAMQSHASEARTRIIAATAQNIAKKIEEGAFRQDLFYRLNVVSLEIPPLRDRAADIQELAGHLMAAQAARMGKDIAAISPEAVLALQSYDWPGNMRQLRNTIEWMLIMHGGKGVTSFGKEHLPPDITGAGEASAARLQILDFLSFPLREAREMFERDYLNAQIKRFEGNISKTAQFVGMERAALHRKLKSLSADETPGINVVPLDQKRQDG